MSFTLCYVLATEWNEMKSSLKWWSVHAPTRVWKLQRDGENMFWNNHGISACFKLSALTLVRTIVEHMDIFLPLCKRFAASYQVFMSIMDKFNWEFLQRSIIMELVLKLNPHTMHVWEACVRIVQSWSSFFEELRPKFSYSWGVLKSLLLTLGLPPSRITFPF